MMSCNKLATMQSAYNSIFQIELLRIAEVQRAQMVSVKRP